MIGQFVKHFGHPRQTHAHPRLGRVQAALHRVGDFLELQAAEETQPQGVGLRLAQSSQQRLELFCPLARSSIASGEPSGA